MEVRNKRRRRYTINPNIKLTLLKRNTNVNTLALTTKVDKNNDASPKSDTNSI